MSGMSESREVRDRSSDEDTIRYSVSEREGGPASTAPPTAPDVEGGGRKKKRRRIRGRGAHPPRPPLQLEVVAPAMVVG